MLEKNSKLPVSLLHVLRFLNGVLQGKGNPESKVGEEVSVYIHGVRDTTC